jgi:tetratricopeptide (TPR) repeat protein
MAIFHNPNAIKLYLVKAEILERLWDLKGAQGNLRIVIKKDPQNEQAAKMLLRILASLGLQYQQQGRFESAVRMYSEAIELAPTKPSLAVLKATAEVAARRFREALDTMNRAMLLTKSPTADMYILRAKIHAALHHLDGYHKDMTKACDLDPNHIEVSACLQEDRGDLALTRRSSTCCHQARIFQDQVYVDAEQQYQRALELVQERNFDKAVATLQTAVATFPQDFRFVVALLCCVTGSESHSCC